MTNLESKDEILYTMKFSTQPTSYPKSIFEDEKRNPVIIHDKRHCAKASDGESAPK
jgi:hypothetical protein